MKLFLEFSTHFLFKKMLFLLVMILFLTQNSNAQCTTCDFNLTTNSNNYTFATGTTCVTTNVTLENSVTFATGAIICISPGVTLNFNNVNNFNFPASGGVTLNTYGTMNINGNPTFAGNIIIDVKSGGSFTSSGTVKFNGSSSHLINNGTVTVPNLELGTSKNLIIDNFGTMNVNGNMNLASGTSYVRNLSNITITSNYSTSATSTYINCGTYTGQFNLGGGKVINTGIFNSSQIDMGGNSSALFENYNKVNLTGNLNMGGLNSVFYNQGVVDASTGQGHIQSDGLLKGPSTGKGYFLLRIKTNINHGTIGPNLNFTRSDLLASTTQADIFVNNITVQPSVTFGQTTPTISPILECPNADGTPSTPVPTSSSACAGVDLTTLQPVYSNITYEWFTGTSTTRTTQVTSLTSPKVTCYTTVGTVYLWAKDNGSGTYSLAGTPVTITDCATAWKTTGNGSWSDTNIWQYRNAAGAWITIASPPYNNKPVYISDGTTVTIPATITTINADSLVIESTGKLVVSNAITINSPLVFEINQSGSAGQLLGACGNVTMGASSKLIARKTLDNTWDFISFPFAVANIYIANTTTTADWGDLSSNIVDGKEFIVAEYDAQARANAGTISTNSTYFKSVSPHTFTAQKGYIITGGAGLTSPSTITLDFVSADGASLGFCDKLTTLGDLSYITGTTCANAWGWNLVGTPYTAAYNLYYASTTASPALKPYYVYNGSTYTTVITTPANDYAINPFSAFFLQTTAATQALNYDDAGLTNLTSHTVGSQSAPALRASIMLSQNVSTDVTAINLDENAATEYVKGEDVVRMSNSSSTAPQIYTEAEGACSALSINTLPMNTNKVNLKVKFGKLGLNTIKLINAEKANGFNAVTLVDTETTIQTDLLKDSYSFENTATGETSRFYILLSQTANTGLNDFSNDNIKAIVIGNEIQLNGIDGRARVNIYDLVGKTMGMYQSVNNNESIRINKQGIYFMDVLSDSQHSTVKVIIK